jgi:hypothetical protein
VKVEHDVELSDLGEEAIQDLHKEVDRLENRKLIVAFINAHYEE